VASLAVLDQGFPIVSLVPFGVLRDPIRFIILISDLSPHTAALRQDPRCSLLIHRAPQPEDPQENHALTRLSIKGSGRFLSRQDASENKVSECYSQKYPQITDMLLSLGDFHFCEILPTEGTLIQGFGKAFRVSGKNLDTIEHLTGR
jgi:putative heme iron utilization protein